MKIAFNPSTVAALTAPPNNKDITFDLRGRNIFARGVKFYGTDTNTWRDIKINNVSIGSHTLDLRNGSNITLSNTNGVVAINSTWRPVVDNLTSNSTTSSLSANQGRVLAGLINGKSDSDHNHDGRYVRKSGDTMSGVLTIDTTNFGALTIKRNDDVNGASIQFRGKSNIYGYIGFNAANRNKQLLRWNGASSQVYTILDTSSTYISGGKGVINGTTITQVDNADKLDGYHANTSQSPFGRVPTIGGDGVMEIGKYIDFHYDNEGKYDYSTRLQATGNHQNTLLLPSGTGTLALTSQIPNKNSWNYDDRYLKLTGGAMVGTINRRSGGSTISGRDHAIIRQTYAPGGSSWNPIACVDTETGTWTLGHLSSGSSNTDFSFCFSTNADYNAGNNAGNYVTLRNRVGTIALTSEIPSKGSWNYDDRYYTKAESNAKYITDITTSVNKLTFTKNGSSIARTITVNNVQSLGKRSPLTERNAISGIYTYGTYSATDNLAPTNYFETLGFGEGVAGTIEIGGSWISGGKLYWRALRDCCEDWFSWKTILDSSNYSSILDSRYYTESEVNSLLSKKLDRINLSVGTWNPRGYSLAADYHYNGGNLSISENGSKMYVSIDGQFYQNEGQYRVLDTSDIGSIRGGLTLYQHLSATDANWYPLVWGGSDHKNTNNSTGSLYKSYDKLSWQTSSQTLYATRLQTTDITFPNSGTSMRGIQGTVGDNDFWRIKGGATASNSGYLEIATANEGNEPIYVRQYTGTFGTIKRTLTLLDTNGFAHFPSYINIGGNENNNSSPDRVWGSNGSDSYLRSYRTSALRVAYAINANSATIASSANKLTTARNIALGTDLRGSANFDGSGNITIYANINACTVQVSSTNGLPFKRIAHFETGGSWNDNALLLYISQGYINGSNGICRVEFRTDNISSSSTSITASAAVRWLVRNGYGLDSLYAGYYVTAGKAYIDIYLKTTGGYQGTVIRVLQDSRGGINSNVQLINSYYHSDTNHKEAYNSIEAASTALYNRAYTRIVQGSDIGTVSYSNSTGSVHWNNVTNKPSTFNPAAHTHSWASITDKIVAGNEFNIVNAGFKNLMWFNYLPINDRSKTATISGYHFGNGAKGYASIVASGFIKSGGNASQLLRADGGVAAFNWSGQAGQPTWLWGGNSQHSYYVYNPSNFKVASATKLQTARKIWGQSFDGTTDIDNTLRIRKTTGNYCEGIRIQTGDGNWATIILGATADSGTNTNAWSIHRKSDNNFAISRNSPDGTNGLVMTSTGMGLGTTTPTQRLDVAGNIRATGQLYLPTNGNYNAILMGDDCWMGDCNIGNVIGLSGRGNANAGGIKFGKGGMYIGYNGSNHYSSGTSLWSNFNADLLDGEHASAFTKIVGRHSISTTGTAPYKYIHLFRIANSNGYSTVDCEIDLRTRNHSAKLEIRIATPQYPYGAGSSISIIKKVINGRSCNLWVLQTIQSSGYNYYDIYYESGTWNSGVYDIILRGSNGNLVFEHKGTKLDTLPSKASIVTNQWVMWNDIAGKPSSFNPAAHNHDGRYLRLDGSDTMTGILKVKANQSNDGYDGAINMNNSNIYGLNSIYTSDKSESQAEGIHFWRDTTHVDTLRMMDGKLLFTPNRPLGKSGTEQTVLHTGNSSVSGQTITINGNKTTWTNTWRPLGTGVNDAAAGNHTHDYLIINEADTNKFNSSYHNFQVLYAGGSNGIEGRPKDVDAFGLFRFRVAAGFSGQILLANGGDLYIRSAADASLNKSLPWKRVIDSGNIGSQSVAYASKAGSVAWANVTGKPTIPNPTDYYWANIKVSASSNTQTKPSVNTIYANNWFRSQGASGWYSESYGGGIYMSDTTWIKTYGDKPFYCNKQIYSSDSIRMGDIYLQNKNEINNGANGDLHLNYRNTGDIILCNGGGKVGIGKSDPLYKLDVAGNGRFQDFVYCNAVYSNTLNHTSPTGHLIIGNKTKEISIRSSYLPDVPAVYLYQKFSTNVYYTANKGFGIRPYYLSSMDYRPIETISGNMYSVVTVGDSVQAISCIIADKANLVPQIRGTLIRFLPGDDGQIVLLKDLNNYGSTNGYFYVQPKGCNIIRSDNSNISIADGNISDTCDDGKSRFFIYAKTHKVWIEFYCG